jgi:hypothetical protein
MRKGWLELQLTVKLQLRCCCALPREYGDWNTGNQGILVRGHGQEQAESHELTAGQVSWLQDVAGARFASSVTVIQTKQIERWSEQQQEAGFRCGLIICRAVIGWDCTPGIKDRC